MRHKKLPRKNIYAELNKKGIEEKIEENIQVQAKKEISYNNALEYLQTQDDYADYRRKNNGF